MLASRSLIICSTSSAFDLLSLASSSKVKLTMLLMKLSLIITCLIFFQSLVSSPSNRQIDSRASLTAAGGLVIARTSTRCCRFIELTAMKGMKGGWRRTMKNRVGVVKGGFGGGKSG
uniref:Uncharacterized protein n=1 Tax=Myripristis murdjan TaxID=586833 RepID=A0A667Z761_9TELE